MLAAGRRRSPYLPIEGARELPAGGAGAAVRRRPRGGRVRPRGDDPVDRLERRPQGRRRLPQALVPRQRGLGQRPDLGQPPRDVRRRRPHGPHLPVLRRGHRRRCASTRCSTRCARCRAHSVVLLHACCHNPTGVDLTRAQWDALIPVLRERELLPYLDLAYQGFGDGIEDDAYAAARAGRRRRCSFFVANSFSKSMSVYGERCGALSVVCAEPRRGRARARASSSSRCGATTRARRSTAASIVATVLGEPALRSALGADVTRDARAHPGDARTPARGARRQAARARLRLLPQRSAACSATPASSPRRSTACATSTRVYLVRSGRMCVAGLNTRNVEPRPRRWPRCSIEALRTVLGSASAGSHDLARAASGAPGRRPAAHGQSISTCTPAPARPAAAA